MPGILLERPKMSLKMHENLKKYILRERKKKKEEDVANEQKMKEELVGFIIHRILANHNLLKYLKKKRKAEMNTQTLEQTKEQIKQIEIKIEELNKV